jgi:hypothetical protein
MPKLKNTFAILFFAFLFIAGVLIGGWSIGLIAESYEARDSSGAGIGFAIGIPALLSAISVSLVGYFQCRKLLKEIIVQSD